MPQEAGIVAETAGCRPRDDRRPDRRRLGSPRSPSPASVRIVVFGSSPSDARIGAIVAGSSSRERAQRRETHHLGTRAIEQHRRPTGRPPRRRARPRRNARATPAAEAPMADARSGAASAASAGSSARGSPMRFERAPGGGARVGGAPSDHGRRRSAARPRAPRARSGARSPLRARRRCRRRGRR